jgi:hypothetical protein
MSSSLFENVNRCISGEELNRLHNHLPFYKFIRQDKTHHGFEYRKGMNVDTVAFHPTSTCSAGGLYFTTAQYVHLFFGYGKYLCEVHIPPDARCYIEENKIKADRLIVPAFTPVADSILLQSDLTVYLRAVTR